MQELQDELKTPLVELLLSIADDKLVLGHRTSDWTGLAPILEEDIAFSAISQEEIAHAAALYEIVGSIQGKSADALALGRTVDEYRCANLVVLPDEFDWACALSRQFLCDHFDVLRLERLSRSAFAPVAAIAARLYAEEVTHLEHCDNWMVHLGKGTEEARDRVQSALDRLATHAAMLFEKTEGQDKLEKAGLYPRGDGDIFDLWQRPVQAVCKEAGLKLQVARAAPDAVGGRRGQHSDELKTLLDEMCEVYRIEPEAAW